MSSWLIGWWLRRRLPATVFVQRHRRALQRLERWGPYALLFSWLPVIGDPLCVAAGWLRFNLFTSLLLISLGKGARYWVLLQLL